MKMSRFSCSLPVRSALKTQSLQDRVSACTTVEGILNIVNVNYDGSFEARELLFSLTAAQFRCSTFTDLEELEFSERDAEKLMQAFQPVRKPPVLAVTPRRRLSFVLEPQIHEISPHSDSANSSSFSSSASSMSSANSMGSTLFGGVSGSIANVTPLRRATPRSRLRPVQTNLPFPEHDKENVEVKESTPLPSMPERNYVRSMIDKFNQQCAASPLPTFVRPKYEDKCQSSPKRRPVSMFSLSAAPHFFKHR